MHCKDLLPSLTVGGGGSHGCGFGAPLDHRQTDERSRSRASSRLERRRGCDTHTLSHPRSTQRQHRKVSRRLSGREAIGEAHQCEHDAREMCIGAGSAYRPCPERPVQLDAVPSPKRSMNLRWSCSAPAQPFDPPLPSEVVGQNITCICVG